MLRQGYFIVSFSVALAAILLIVGLGGTASSLSTKKGPAPPAATTPSGEKVARSDDGDFSIRLISSHASYLFGRQRIEVAPEVPAGDAVHAVDFFVDGHLRRTTNEPPYVADIDFGEDIERHAILIQASTRQGRSARLSLISRSASPPTRVEVNLVTVPVSVRDSEGRFVENLSLSDFTLLEDGQRQTIAHFDRDPTPVSLILVIDSSDSMKGTLWSVQKAANDFIASLPSFYKIGIIGFDEAVTLARDFSYDRRGLAAAVNRLKPSGGTALYDAIRAAATQLRGRGDRRAAVLFTDGGESVYGNDEEGKKRLEESLRTAREAAVTFFTIGFGPRAAEDLLRRIADETAGRFYDSRDPGALRSIYGKIADELNHQYTLSYYPTRPTAEGGWRKLTVGVQRADAIVKARPGYLAGR